ncbi:MAG: Lrp/AsnC family transcriptional regulator [Propionibacterium freudenreichii]
MITAIVFVHADNDRISEVAEQIAGLEHVTEVYSVTGDIDFVVMVRVAGYEEIAPAITDQLKKVPGVIDTDTHLAFRAYSEHDLEAAFSL